MARTDRNGLAGAAMRPAAIGAATGENEGVNLAIFDDAELQVFAKWSCVDWLPVHRNFVLPPTAREDPTRAAFAAG